MTIKATTNSSGNPQNLKEVVKYPLILLAIMAISAGAWTGADLLNCPELVKLFTAFTFISGGTSIVLGLTNIIGYLLNTSKTSDKPTSINA